MVPQLLSEVLPQRVEKGGEVRARDGGSRDRPGCNSGIALMTWPGRRPQRRAAPAPSPLLACLPPFLFAPCCLPQSFPPEAAAAAPRSTVAGVLAAPQDRGFPYGIILPDDRTAPVGDDVGAFLLPFATRETRGPTLFPGIPQPLQGCRLVLHPLKGDPTGQTPRDGAAGAEPAMELGDAPSAVLRATSSHQPCRDHLGVLLSTGTRGDHHPLRLSRSVPCTGPAGHTPPTRSVPPEPAGKTDLVNIGVQAHGNQGHVSSCLHGSSQVGGVWG